MGDSFTAGSTATWRRIEENITAFVGAALKVESIAYPPQQLSDTTVARTVIGHLSGWLDAFASQVGREKATPPNTRRVGIDPKNRMR